MSVCLCSVSIVVLFFGLLLYNDLMIGYNIFILNCGQHYLCFCIAVFFLFFVFVRSSVGLVVLSPAFFVRHKLFLMC